MILNIKKYQFEHTFQNIHEAINITFKPFDNNFNNNCYCLDDDEEPKINFI